MSSPARRLALVHAFISIHLRADQIVSGTAVNFLALGVTGYFFIDVYTDQGTPGDVLHDPIGLPRLARHSPTDSFVDKSFGDWNVLIWVALALVVHLATSCSSVRRSAFACARCGEHPKAADTVGISVYGDPLRRGRAVGRARRAWAGCTSRTASRTRSRRT